MRKCASMSACFNNKCYITHFCVIFTEVLIAMKCFWLLFSADLVLPRLAENTNRNMFLWLSIWKRQGTIVTVNYILTV